MTSKMLKAMMEAQKKARMDKRLDLKPFSSSQKVVYVPPIRATITKVTPTPEQSYTAAIEGLSAAIRAFEGMKWLPDKNGGGYNIGKPIDLSYHGDVGMLVLQAWPNMCGD